MVLSAYLTGALAPDAGAAIGKPGMGLTDEERGLLDLLGDTDQARAAA